jgi:hypothetical protein
MKNGRFSDAQIMGILKRMYAEMSMQNDLLKEALEKKR